MRKSRKEYTDANRLAWDEAAARHAAHNNAALFEAVKDPAFVSFDGDILQTLQRVGVAGKRIIQLGCNNGAGLRHFQFLFGSGKESGQASTRLHHGDGCAIARSAGVEFGPQRLMIRTGSGFVDPAGAGAGH